MRNIEYAWKISYKVKLKNISPIYYNAKLFLQGSPVHKHPAFTQGPGKGRTPRGEL